MDSKSIEKAIFEIVEKKKILSNLDYSDERYDDLEEELHDFEDDFLEKYGTYLEKALEEVHAKHCPDNDILLPIAYIANQYEKIGEDPSGAPLYDVSPNQGVYVDVDKKPGVVSKLVIVPSPLRLVLSSPKSKEIVWKAK